VEPIDGATGGVFRDPLDAIVEGPTGIAAQVAFPLGEEIADNRVEVSRQNPRLEVREQPAPHAPINQRLRPAPLIGVVGVPPRNVILVRRLEEVRMLRENGLGQSLRLERRQERRRELLRPFHEQLVELDIHSEGLSSFCARSLNGLKIRHCSSLYRLPRLEHIRSGSSSHPTGSQAQRRERSFR
jgi:hypothetical protein